jgi:hypothetical protein
MNPDRKNEKKPNREGEKREKPKPEGATPGLAVFDYSSTHRLDVRQFNEAIRQIIDFCTINFGRVSEILEFNQEANFNNLKPATPEHAVRAFNKKKAEIEWNEDDEDESASQAGFSSSSASKAKAAAAAQKKKANALKDLEDLGMLQLEAEIAKDNYLKGMADYERVKREYNENKIKMYGVLYGQMTVAMRHRVQEDSTFNDIQRGKKLLDLWKLIKKVSMEERGTPTTNPIKRLEDARSVFSRVRQYGVEKLGDFYDRFNTEVAIFEAAGGTFDNRDETLAMLFLQKLDKKRYNNTLVEWENSLADGTDIYPKTLPDALKRINSRKVADPATGVAGQGVAFATQGQEQPKGKKSTGNGSNCYFCDQPGHRKKNCPLLEKAYKLFDEENSKKQSDTKVNNGKINMTVSEALIENCDRGFGFVIQNHHTYSSAVLHNHNTLDPFDLLCDCQSTVNLVHNEKLLTNIRKAKVPLSVSGISGEQLIVTKVGDLGDFGEVYYHPAAKANILCFYDLSQKYTVTYDTSVMDAFIVKTDKRTLLFEPKGKLYVYNPIKSFGDSEVVLMMNTVAENKSRYTHKEIKQAEIAHDLYIKLARPALNDFIRIVREGRILNCPITVADIKRWVDIFGVDLGTLKGRTTRLTAPVVKIETSPVDLSNPQPVVLAADIMFIESIPFFICISRKLDLITVRNLQNRGGREIADLIRQLNSVYRQRGYRIDTIMSDGEGGMKNSESHIGALGIKTNFASKGEHVPEVERAIRQVKERVRGFMTTLPYKMDELMIIHLVYYCVAAINSIPRSGESESPKEVFTGVKIDYSRDCKLGFGEYVQVHDDNAITNTMEPRTLGAISLGNSGNAQGAYKFLLLHSWKVVQRRSWKVLPIPEEVITFINNKVDPPRVEHAEPVVPAAPNLTPNENQQIIEDIEDFILARQREVEAQTAYGVREPIDTTWFSSEQPDEKNESPNPESTFVTTNGKQNKWQLLLRQLDVLEKHARIHRGIALSTMSVKVGIKKHGQAALKSLFEELKQLHDKGVFEAIDQNALTEAQLKRILRTLLFMKEKRDGRLKSRLCVDGSKQTLFGTSVDPSSPTVLPESIFLSLAIDAAEERIVKTADIEGAYLIADMPDEVLVMFDEMLAAAMLQVAPEYASFEKLGKLVFKLKKALYGCIQSARLFFEHLRSTLINMGFTQNPYDRCVFNKIIDGHQCTILVYVDDLKISCKVSRGVDETLAELQKTYKKMTVKDGAKMDYLGMLLDFTTKGVVKISMTDLIDEVLEDCPVDKLVTSPAANYLFEINSECSKLSQADKELFHSMVAKLLYLAKRGRPDILLPVIFLTTRVQAPDLDDKKKLLRVTSYLKATRNYVLTLGADDLRQITIYIDASHAVHGDAKSHTGVVITMGKGVIFAKSSKQKLVSKSSTAAELIALSDGIDYAIWAQEFMKSQGYDMKPLIVYQDNKSTITLAENGKSTNQRTRHINIRYYAVKDLIDKGEVIIVYKPTAEMIADYLTKPLQGKLFVSARNFIMCMSEVDAETHVPPQGCVE